MKMYQDTAIDETIDHSTNQNLANLFHEVFHDWPSANSSRPHHHSMGYGNILAGRFRFHVNCSI